MAFADGDRTGNLLKPNCLCKHRRYVGEVTDIFMQIFGITAGNFEKFYYKYKDLVFSVCRRILKNEEDASDASQETFSKLFKNRDLLRDETLERQWVIEAARCVSLDMLRKERRMPSMTSLDEVEPFLAQEDRNPESIVLGEESVDRIYNAIDKLDLKYATPLVYKYYFDLKPAEIARFLGLNINTVNTRLRRGQLTLKRSLYEYDRRTKAGKGARL